MGAPASKCTARSKRSKLGQEFRSEDYLQRLLKVVGCNKGDRPEALQQPAAGDNDCLAEV